MTDQMVGKPVPRPQRIVPIEAPPAEFAHVLKVARGEVAAVFVGRRSGGRVWADQVWVGAVGETQQVVVDQVIELIRAAQTLPEPLVLVGPHQVMLRLQQLGFNDPHVQLDARGRKYLSEVLDLADAWCEQQTQAAAAADVPVGMLVVATDASVGLGRKSAGLGCVDEHGRQVTGRLRSRNVLYCELRAIQLALEHFRGPLRILSDSLDAVRRINEPYPNPRPGRVTTLADTIRAVLQQRGSSVEWVRGHNGHPLNEAADRLAMAARRATELQLPRQVEQQIRHQIVGDLIGGAA